jgi:hypothetical protein
VEHARPAPSRPRCGGSRPSRGQPTLEGEGSRVLRGTPLESLAQLTLREVGQRAVAAAVEMTLHVAHRLGSEASVLEVEQLIANVETVHG